jgi:hypothetical protein
MLPNGVVQTATLEIGVPGGRDQNISFTANCNSRGSCAL